MRRSVRSSRPGPDAVAKIKKNTQDTTVKSLCSQINQLGICNNTLDTFTVAVVVVVVREMTSVVFYVWRLLIHVLAIAHLCRKITINLSLFTHRTHSEHHRTDANRLVYVCTESKKKNSTKLLNHLRSDVGCCCSLSLPPHQ